MSRSMKAEVLQRFLKDTAEHQLQVLKEEGLYRHLRFRKPGTGCYGFDIVTWPGHLAITGDMGNSLFSRLTDMLEFFRNDRKDAENDSLYINSGYWAEKCVANDGEKREFRKELFEAVVKQHFDDFIDQARDEDGKTPNWAGELWDELENEVLFISDENTSEAIQAMDAFKPSSVEPYADFRISDAWEYGDQLQDYTFHFYWRLYAIAHAVKAYDSRSEVA